MAAQRHEMLHPRRIQECLQCCPPAITNYAMMHLDSLGSILNHILVLMLVCNLFLFFSSWSISFLPTMGFSTVMVSFLLCCQNVCVWLIGKFHSLCPSYMSRRFPFLNLCSVNNNRISALSFLSPTEFMVGVALGITVGGAVLAFVISGAFRHVSQCSSTGNDGASTDPVYEYICGHRKGSMSAVWFWSGIVFWLNFVCALLIAIGKQELTNQHHQYENIGTAGMTMDDYESHFRANASGVPQTPQFVGDYANIPDIRSGDDESHTSSTMMNAAGRHHEYKVPDEKARINSV